MVIYHLYLITRHIYIQIDPSNECSLLGYRKQMRSNQSNTSVEPECSYCGEKLANEDHDIASCDDPSEGEFSDAFAAELKLGEEKMQSRYDDMSLKEVKEYNASRRRSMKAYLEQNE